ncbi:MAG: carbon-nitrogen hydrolase family protein [Bdellovibrionota bacterium]
MFLLLFTFLLNLHAEVQPIKEVFEPKGNFSSEEYVKVAVVQTSPGVSPVPATKAQAERTKATNRSQLEEWVRQAVKNGAEYVVTPEFGVIGYPDIPELSSEDDNYRSREDVEPYVETIPGPTTKYFGKIAKELNTYIQFGLAEVDSKTNKYYNVAVVVAPSGEVVAKHRKINLFEIENNFLSAGTDGVTFDSIIGKVGLIICSDVYDSDVLSAYKRNGVEVLALSTSWAQYNTGMNYFKRAAQVVSGYLLAANQTYFPDSGVIKPDGTTQSHIRQTEGIAYGYLPRKK